MPRELRRQLENTVRAARRIAEAGAQKSLEQLAAGNAKAPGHLSPERVKYRNALRAHGRQLGDTRDPKSGAQTLHRLVREFAYQHWHRMLFARYLAENDLLIEPESGVAITLDECRELARERQADWLALASDYAEIMLPQIFRNDDPVLKVNLPPETRSELDDLLKALPSEVFISDDSLGWVYQFWQADSKEAVNRSGDKIGADELPAVTQLFTEDYMVAFLLHNTLGAWWAGKTLAANPDLANSAQDEESLRAACALDGVTWAYLRFVRDEEGSPWRPAAGCFDGWPEAAKDIRLLDPCMGSGHFLVFALPLLAAMRAQEEGLAPDAAIEAVLRDNLYGLELDPRCTQIAAFNLALAAWRRVGHRALPALHLACSGLSLGVSKTEWLKLAERTAAELPVAPDQDLLGTKSENLFSDATRRGFERLYDLFAKAPTLGSLIQPGTGGDLVEADFAKLAPLLAKVMAKTDNAELSEMAVAAQGLAKAAEILAGDFTLVATNVPYLGRGKQDETLKKYCQDVYPAAKADLATCFVERCLAFCSEAGSAALVTPQNWLFLGTYKHLRKRLLEDIEWNAVARLGEHGFESPQAAGAFTSLLALTARKPHAQWNFAAYDASAGANAAEKALELQGDPSRVVSQAKQLCNPEKKVVLGAMGSVHERLEDVAHVSEGLHTGDYSRFGRNFWELPRVDNGWVCQEAAADNESFCAGKENVLFWEDGSGVLLKFVQGRLGNETVTSWIKGEEVWGRRGIAVSTMRDLRQTLYIGTPFTHGAFVIAPKDENFLAAIWMFCETGKFAEQVRRLDQKVCVARKSIAYVPFDLDHWQRVAAEAYPHGLPKAHSDDPTQWIFNGHPKGSDGPLQVAVTRLVGYRWPRQTGSSFPDCPALESDGLGKHADNDGIVSLSPTMHESAAADRLRDLLADAYGKEWSAGKLATLLANAGHEGITLDDWLRDHFFSEHCALFHQRPFVWHIWDGRRDGFNALVNYHRLAAGNGEGRRLLSKLIYSTLGDWINRQAADQKAGAEGADARLAAAMHLKTELEKILAGEPPYDLFVRWKPLAEQPIGWEPDINDGVRLNIRPFMTARPFQARARNACILRAAPKIKWTKDRGKEPQRPRDEYPWFWGWDEVTQDFKGGKEFDGNRWNDLHYSVAPKQAARAKRSS